MLYKYVPKVVPPKDGLAPSSSLCLHMHATLTPMAPGPARPLLAPPVLSLFETIFFSFVKEVGLGAAKVDNFGTPISILLLLAALATVIRIGDARPTADHASTLVRAVVTLVTNPYQSCGSNVTVADYTFAIAFLAKSADGNAGLLAAHDEIWVVLGHGRQLVSLPGSQRERPAL